MSKFRLVSTLTPNTRTETAMQPCGDLTTFLAAPSPYTKERMITIKQKKKLRPPVLMDVPPMKESVKVREEPLPAVSSAARAHPPPLSLRTTKPPSCAMKAFAANSLTTEKLETSRASKQSRPPNPSLNPSSNPSPNPLQRKSLPSEVLQLNR